MPVQRVGAGGVARALRPGLPAGRVREGPPTRRLHGVDVAPGISRRRRYNDGRDEADRLAPERRHGVSPVAGGFLGSAVEIRPDAAKHAGGHHLTPFADTDLEDGGPLRMRFRDIFQVRRDPLQQSWRSAWIPHPCKTPECVWTAELLGSAFPRRRGRRRPRGRGLLGGPGRQLLSSGWAAGQYRQEVGNRHQPGNWSLHATVSQALDTGGWSRGLWTCPSRRAGGEGVRTSGCPRGPR